MSVHDVEEFVELLYRYAETELDQWDNWRLDTGFPVGSQGNSDDQASCPAAGLLR